MIAATMDEYLAARVSLKEKLALVEAACDDCSGCTYLSPCQGDEDIYKKGCACLPLRVELGAMNVPLVRT